MLEFPSSPGGSLPIEVAVEITHKSWICLLSSEDVLVGEMGALKSNVEAGEAVGACGVLGDVEEYTESRDAGASKRKLHSKPFLLQFAHEGCFASHYTMVSIRFGEVSPRMIKHCVGKHP